MLNPGDFAYFKYLAKEAVGRTEVSFDRRRLMIKTNFTTDKSYSGEFIFVFFVCMYSLLALAIAIITTTWLLLLASISVLIILLWISKRRLNSRDKNIHRPPDFVFDSELKSFFILKKSTISYPKPCYERYASNALLATRIRVINSTEYSDDVVVELSFEKDTWVTALEVASSVFAYELEQAIKKCAVFAE